MQNDIRIHLAANEQQQSDIEIKHASALQKRFQANLAAFARCIPNIANTIQTRGLISKSIFVDKNGCTNIVDVASGTSFYHFDVDNEIAKQCEQLSLHSVLLDVQANSASTPKYLNSFDDFTRYTNTLNEQLLSSQIDALVVFGLGKATHVQALIEQSQAPHVLIYEHNWEYFLCSLYCTDWYLILEQAERHQRQLYFQVGQSEFSLQEDIAELIEVFDVRNTLFFKHYNESHFDIVMRELRGGNLSILQQANYPEQSTPFQEWIPAWTPSFCISDWQRASSDSERFTANFEAFEKYFENIATTYKDYQSEVWEPIVHRQTGQVNLFNKKHNTIHMTEQVRTQAEAICTHFKRYPNQDGLIFGYESDKLKHYLHNTFIRRANTILINQKNEKGALPEQVKALILFGIENGYVLESLLDSTEIDNVFLCEPNPDFFYASMFAIDWAKILQNIDENEKRIYLNVGEAGTAIYTDLNKQFLTVGAHLLADAYFFQTYENQILSRVIKDLRDQLKITFSLTENFDHVLYGIEHTKYALQQSIPAMAAEPHKLISKDVKALPLFVVGNGPSLDNNIQLVKDYREQILVVSCGTALQALHSYGITPDFHAEVEQCRATFDWASRINDPAYLKSITLVSVNGIHPDTCGIYKDTLFGFKQGESSANSATSIFGPEKFAFLERAYPTVTNLAVNFFLKLGFNQLYLLGVDLGFVDYNKHHSSQSGYFENGKQIYDYQDNLAKSLPVKGNFRDLVYTKAEFNISRMMMEQVLSQYKVDCYNLSDGVFIEGTQALMDDAVLILNPPIDRQACYHDIKNAFIVVQSDVRAAYKAAFSQQILNEQIHCLQEICSQSIDDKASIELIISKCRELMHENMAMGRSLFVYYFFGSLNNLCATLNKALMSEDESQALDNASRILGYWSRFTEDALLMINQDEFLFDTSSSFSEKREAPRIVNQRADAVVFNTQLMAYLNAQKDQRFSLYSVLPEGYASEYCLIFISSLSDVDQTMSIFSQLEHSQLEQQKEVKVLLVYTDASLFNPLHQKVSMALQGKDLPPHLCMLYLPLWTSLAKLTKIEQGYEPLIDYEEASAFLLARLEDIERFTHMIFRARFDESGLIRANNDKEDEYLSDASDYLASRFAPLLSIKYAYSFKRYIGFITNFGLTKNSGSVENTAPKSSMLDALENRGLYIPRELEPYELLGEWYKTQQGIEIRSHIEEHFNSV